MPDILSKPLDICQYDNENDFFNAAYQIFQTELNFQHNRPNLFNKPIFIDATEKINGMIKGFWHVASIGDNDYKYDMYPCNNDIANGMCKYMCNVIHQDNFLSNYNSIPCIFRASRVRWIKEIIDLANKDPNNPRLNIWTHKNKRKREKNLKIRYKNKHIDFIIIFAIRYKKNKNDIKSYRLITAYPVVLKSYKKRFDKEYENYISKK